MLVPFINPYNNISYKCDLAFYMCIINTKPNYVKPFIYAS